MPMLMTLRIGLPVCPRHAPERILVAKSAIRPRTSCTCATTSVPSTISEVPFGMRSATCSTERFSDDVDPLAGEHRVPVVLELRLLGQLQQQAHGLVGDAVLRVVEVEPGCLGAEPLAARGVLGE